MKDLVHDEVKKAGNNDQKTNKLEKDKQKLEEDVKALDNDINEKVDNHNADDNKLQGTLDEVLDALQSEDGLKRDM